MGKWLGCPVLSRLWKQIQHPQQAAPLSSLWLHHVQEVHGLCPLAFGSYVSPSKFFVNVKSVVAFLLFCFFLIYRYTHWGEINWRAAVRSQRSSSVGLERPCVCLEARVTPSPPQQGAAAVAWAPGGAASVASAASPPCWRRRTTRRSAAVTTAWTRCWRGSRSWRRKTTCQISSNCTR